MKLYHAPGASALASHSVADEAGLPIDIVKAYIRRKQTEYSQDHLGTNPNRCVPALTLDDGSTLAEALFVKLPRRRKAGPFRHTFHIEPRSPSSNPL